jgi:hypothetical protein
MGIQRIGYFGGGNTAGGNLGREFCGNSIGIHMGMLRICNFGGGNNAGGNWGEEFWG